MISLDALWLLKASVVVLHLGACSFDYIRDLVLILSHGLMVAMKTICYSLGLLLLRMIVCHLLPPPLFQDLPLYREYVLLRLRDLVSLQKDFAGADR